MSFLDLPDDQLLLLLCIREEELDEPAAWCREWRALSREMDAGPRTSAEADALWERNEQLCLAVKKSKLPQ